MTTSTTLDRRVLAVLLVFVVSGFSGLVYESAWSHYMALFLGHAAYAQTLVLAIFMGGLALGAALAGRYSHRIDNLLAAYAVVEGLIAVGGLLFHGVFVALTAWTHEFLAPALGSGIAILTAKWTLGALMMLPQSVLLGMTFPLISAGLVREMPGQSGATLSVLYFTNSLGAAAGALATAFWLLPAFGLPGSLLTAAVINVFVAVVVWFMSRPTPLPQPAPATGDAAQPRYHGMILVAAFLTGTASFVYEIGWIRMLSLALGTTLHSFEIMLSAFILGLALGGLWIRKRLDNLESPVRFAAGVQMLMALMAMVSLISYSRSFEWVALLAQALSKTATGYAFYNTASHAIAIVIMVPTTFLAGMTLPLLTHILLRGGRSEASIGAIYASNTLGAIAGVFLAVHVGFPWLGIEWTMAGGAAIDVLVAIGLLALVGGAGWLRWAPAASLVLIAAIAGIFRLDELSLISGVYRSGQERLQADREVLYLRHGKTATISVVRNPTGLHTIATNGKPDASVTLDMALEPSPDESTMMTAGVLPMVFFPEARTVANIGFGCGLTTHTLLGFEQIERLDSVEIEPAMVEGARQFHRRVQRAFDDPRSRIHYEDAKTFFATAGRQYDVIVSEPSNPWVSGVASLFTDEFYAEINRYLSDGGVLVQWIQLYEINDALVGTVFKALARNFTDYRAYYAHQSDMLIIARRNGTLGRMHPFDGASPALREELHRIGIRSLADLRIRLAGNAPFLAGHFGSYGGAANSDYFPVLSLQAPRTRFEGQFARLTQQPGESRLALKPMLLGGLPDWQALSEVSTVPTSHFARRGAKLARLMTDAGASVDELHDPEYEQHVTLLRLAAGDCGLLGGPAGRRALHALAEATLPFARGELVSGLWIDADWLGCQALRDDPQMSLYAAIAGGEAQAIGLAAESVLNGGESLNERVAAFALMHQAMALLLTGNHQVAQTLLGQPGTVTESARRYFPDDFQLIARLSLTGAPLAPLATGSIDRVGVR